MHERDIVDLRTRQNQHRREIDDLTKLHYEMKIVMDECAKKSAKSDIYEQLLSLHAERFLQLSQRIVEIENTLKSIDQVLAVLSSNKIGLATTLEKLQQSVIKVTEHIDDHKERFDELNIPSQLNQLENDCNCQQRYLEERLADIHKRLVIPFESIIVTHEDLKQKSDKAIADSQKASNISERIGVEIKILNRKMNEILQGQKQ